MNSETIAKLKEDFNLISMDDETIRTLRMGAERLQRIESLISDFYLDLRIDDELHGDLFADTKDPSDFADFADNEIHRVRRNIERALELAIEAKKEAGEVV